MVGVSEMLSEARSGVGSPRTSRNCCAAGCRPAVIGSSSVWVAPGRAGRCVTAALR